jgi:hypothetical protein
MNLVPVLPFSRTEEEMRTTFFEDAFEIMRRDQYSEVNQITPAVIRVQEAIPPKLSRPYVEALMEQARSEAWQGAPAARHALRELPPSMTSELYDILDAERLLQDSHREFIKDFLLAHRESWPEGRSGLYSDFLALTPRAFAVKHLGWDE